MCSAESNIHIQSLFFLTSKKVFVFRLLMLFIKDLKFCYTVHVGLSLLFFVFIEL